MYRVCTILSVDRCEESHSRPFLKFVDCSPSDPTATSDLYCTAIPFVEKTIHFGSPHFTSSCTSTGIVAVPYGSYITLVVQYRILYQTRRSMEEICCRFWRVDFVEVAPRCISLNCCALDIFKYFQTFLLYDLLYVLFVNPLARTSAVPLFRFLPFAVASTMMMQCSPRIRCSDTKAMKRVWTFALGASFIALMAMSFYGSWLVVTSTDSNVSVAVALANYVNAPVPVPVPTSSLPSSFRMAACLLIMDDNHWLVEWLAYHYTALNLRHLIVAIDGRSKTSPVPVLRRWTHPLPYLDITLWNDTSFGFVPPEPAQSERPENYLQDVNLARQQRFLASCLRTHHERGHADWVMTTDTDEFISINPITTRDPKHARHYRQSIPPLTQPGAILAFLRAERQRQANVSCWTMNRHQLGYWESDPQVVQQGVPEPFDGRDFLTLRWLQSAGPIVGPKQIVHLPSIEAHRLPVNGTSQHRVLPHYCPLPGAGQNEQKEGSLLQVYHYFGTREQFDFRNDARKPRGNDGGRNSRWERFENRRRHGDNGSDGRGLMVRDNLRPWLDTFVRRCVGRAEAERLLEGVGRVHGWPAFDNRTTVLSLAT